MLLRIIFPFLLIPGLGIMQPAPLEQDQCSAASHDSLELIHKNYVPAYLTSDVITQHKAFTLCYSEAYEQARWVAYHLTAEMCNNNGEERTNNFRPDPAIPTGSATPDDYKKSGYDRGHLCPAGDMGWNDETMSESFLMSNMSPQLPAFNRGIWKSLESDVREWAKINKEIYVVTAGVLEDGLPTIGPDKVAIPRYYYKVILDVSAPEYKAIAFVLPNKKSSASVFNYAVSIDSVERLTGIDFFPALPDSLEHVLEMQADSTQWKIN
ncbi:MAG: non-specific endonuclease [Bacteroidetes bacterium]|nr:non-specific endonuclease [Bacteroidota bacterium]